MPRTLDPILKAALDSGQFTAYFLLTVRDASTNIVINTFEPITFKLNGIEMTVEFVSLTGSIYGGYSKPEELTFTLTRGIKLNNIIYSIDSSDYYGTNDKWDGITETITACMLPNTQYAAAGDVNYQTAISALCAAFGKTAVFATPAADWLNYQFLPTGRTLALNKANNLLTLLRQKYLIFACDNGSNEILFQAVASNSRTTDHTLELAHFKASPEMAHYRYFVSRDEANTIHYSGTDTDPLWNLGFLPSTADHPTGIASNEIYIEPIAPHLKYLTFDNFKFTFSPNFPNALYTSLSLVANVTEEYSNKFNKIPWRITLESFDWAKSTEGGALPSTIEAAAPYTPLNVSNFDGIFDENDNNIQAAMETADDHTHGIEAPVAAPTATSDFLVGAQVTGVWSWVKKTLAEIKTILGLGSAAYTASSDYATSGHNHTGTYAPAAQGVTNGDSHNHAGGDGAQIDYVNLSNITQRTAFTPVLEGTTIAGAGTYTTQLGEYAVIGDLVLYTIAFVWTNHTGTGNLRVNNLPFTASNNGMLYPVIVNWNNLTLLAVGNKIIAQMNPNTTIISLYEIASGAASGLPMDTAGVLRLSGYYFK